MINRSELKITAKMRMSQSDPSYLKVMLLWVLAAVLVPQAALSFVSSPMEGMERFGELIASGIDPDLALRALQLSSGQVFSAMALNIVLWVYQLVLSFGLARYTLLLYRGDDCGPSDLFTGFSIAGRVLGAELLVSLIAFAWCIALAIPLFGVVVAAMTLGEVVGTLVVCVAVIAYGVGLISIMLNYVLTTLSLADRPDLGAMGAIQFGKNLIRGHKGKYFVLVLSFLGWSLLCSLPAMIFTGVSINLLPSLPTWIDSLISVVLLLPYYLWLTPYMSTTIAGFYDALQNEGFYPELPPL